MELKAKDCSLVAKIMAGLIMVVGAILKWTNIFPNCNVSELSIVAFTVMGLFGTVDLNLMIEKFTGKANE